MRAIRNFPDGAVVLGKAAASGCRRAAIITAGTEDVARVVK